MAMSAPTPEAAASAGTAGAPVREAGLWSDAWRQLRRNPLFLGPAVVIAVFAVMAVVPGLFTRADPRACDLSHSLLRPSARHWFGYDLQGCDYYAKVIHGARVSMTIGIATVAGTALVAVVLGTLAGFYRGRGAPPIPPGARGWVAPPPVLRGLLPLSALGCDGPAPPAVVSGGFGWP